MNARHRRQRRKQLALTPHEVRMVSVEGQVHPHTVRAFLLGTLATRPLSEQRIRAAMEKLGLAERVRPAA